MPRLARVLACTLIARTYKARNGQVIFLLVDEAVTLEAAGPAEKKD